METKENQVVSGRPAHVAYVLPKDHALSIAPSCPLLLSSKMKDVCN